MVVPRRSLVVGLLMLCGLAGRARAIPLVDFDFNEGSGTSAVNHGTLGSALDGVIDGATYSSDTPFGSGSALAFDGVNDFVRVVTPFSYGSQFTIEAWIKPSAVNGQRVIWDDYGNPGVLLALFDGRLQFGISTPQNPGLGIAIYSPIALCTDGWMHVAGIYDGSAIHTYINGEEVGTAAATSGDVIDNPIQNSAIGADNLTTTALNFAGLIDDLRIHPTALSASELGDGRASEGHDCPEPAALGLLGLGLLPLVARRRRAP